MRLTRSRTEHFAQKIEETGDRLRKSAEELDRLAAKARKVQTPDFRGPCGDDHLVGVAADVQREVLTMLYNLHLSYLATDAYDVEQMRIIERETPLGEVAP